MQATDCPCGKVFLPDSPAAAGWERSPEPAFDYSGGSRPFFFSAGGRETLERLAETTTSSLVKSHVEGALRHLQG